MPRVIRVEPGTMAYAMQRKASNGVKTKGRTIGKLIGSVYEPKARAKGLGYHWSHQPKHAFKSACRVFRGPFE